MNLLKFFKYAIVIAALFYLFYFGKISPDDFTLVENYLPLILIGFSLILVSVALTAVRLLILSKAVDISVSFLSILRICFIAAFFNTFLFGGFGGDVLKVGYLARHANNISTSIANVLMDRLTGLFALVCLGGGALGLDWMSGNQNEDLQNFSAYIFGIILICGYTIIFGFIGFINNKRTVFYAWCGASILLLGIVFSIIYLDLLSNQNIQFLGYVTGLCIITSLLAILSIPQLLPESKFHNFCSEKLFLGKQFIGVIDNIFIYRKCGKQLLFSFMISIFSHIAIVFVFYLLSQALVLAVSPTLSHMFFAAPPSILINTLPVPGGGLGVGELALDVILGLCRSIDGQAITGGASIFLFFRFCITIVGLIGMPFYLYNKKDVERAEAILKN